MKNGDERVFRMDSINDFINWIAPECSHIEIQYGEYMKIDFPFEQHPIWVHDGEAIRAVCEIKSTIPTLHRFTVISKEFLSEISKE